MSTSKEQSLSRIQQNRCIDSMTTADTIYHQLEPEFYDSSLKTLNPITSYYHSNRYAKIRRFICSRFHKKMTILDLGCGSSSWNINRLSVTGVDQNKDMLTYGMKKGYISKAVEWDLVKGPLPFKDEQFNFVVISEVLEHLDHPGMTIKEAHRVLKKGGFLIATVPLDTNFSLWQILFGIECFLIGDLLGNEYYRKRCGHVQQFSVEKLANIFEMNDFSVVDKDITIMNIGIIAERR